MVGVVGVQARVHQTTPQSICNTYITRRLASQLCCSTLISPIVSQCQLSFFPPRNIPTLASHGGAQFHGASSVSSHRGTSRRLASWLCWSTLISLIVAWYSQCGRSRNLSSHGAQSHGSTSVSYPPWDIPTSCLLLVLFHLDLSNIFVVLSLMVLSHRQTSRMSCP